MTKPLTDERLKEIGEWLRLDRDPMPKERDAIIAALQEARREVERLRKAETDFYVVVERLGLAEMVEFDDDDNTTSTWVNGRAEAAEAERDRMRNEIEVLKAQLRAKVKFAIGERDAITKEPSNG